MKMRSAAGAAILLFALTGVAAADTAIAGYRAVELLPPGALRSEAWDVNNLGQVAVSASDGTSRSAYIWQSGVFTRVAGPVGAIDTTVFGLSENGLSVGSYTRVDGSGGSLGRTGFLFDGSSYVLFDAPGATITEIRGVSPDGRWVSGSSDGDFKGFVLEDSTGRYLSPDRPETTFSIIQGINAAGIAVGYERRSTSTDHIGFTFDIHTGIRVDGSWGQEARSAFRDIDNQGTIAGWYEWLNDPPPPPPVGVVAPIPMIGAVGSPDDYTVFQWPGMRRTTLQGINDLGWLSGNSMDLDLASARGFVAMPAIPEPGTVPLMLAGAVLVAAAARRRRAR